MKISIITACYNETGTIEKTFQSIFSQTYKNIESIVIDGGSTDGTLDIIEKYRNKITYFVSEPDEGIYNAMNKGIKASSGEVLYFLNANDTLYSDDVIEAVANSFKKGNPDFVYGNLCFLETDKLPKIRFQKQNLKENLLLSSPVWHPASFYKRNLFDKFGLYDENFRIAADHDFNMRILRDKKTKTFYLNKTIANFNMTGLCSDKKYEKIRQMENSLIFYKYANINIINNLSHILYCLKINPFLLFNIKKLFMLLLKNKGK